MTVCIAAITERFTVIGASDRMLTAGDIRFEPDTPKVTKLSNSLFAMTAGDASLAKEIVDDVFAVVGHQIRTNPQEWVPVRFAAEAFAHAWANARRKRAELAILAPLGLTTATFLERQSTMAPDLVDRIATGLAGYVTPPVEAIVAGVDGTGGHIYSIVNGYVACGNSVGFVTIGSGGRHAGSQLMLAEYSPTVSLGEAMLLVHTAKRRAEVGPDVGTATDMLIVGPTPGSLVELGDHVLKLLDNEYEALRIQEQAALHNAKASMADYITELRNQHTKQEQEAGDDQVASQ